MRTLAICCAALALGATAASGQTYAIDWWTIDGGGAMRAVGGIYMLSGTIGQPDAGSPMAGGAYALEGGFWGGGWSIATDVAEPQDGEDVVSGGALPFEAQSGSPNPFRERATMSFRLPYRQQVDLAIYDMAGRLCRTVHSGALDAGRHSMVWDGRDDAGRAVPSGAYFVVLRAASGEHRDKLVKLR